MDSPTVLQSIEQVNLKKNSITSSVALKNSTLGAGATNSSQAAPGTLYQTNQTAGFTGRKNSFNLTFRPKDLEAPSAGKNYMEEPNIQAVHAPRHSEENYLN